MLAVTNAAAARDLFGKALVMMGNRCSFRLSLAALTIPVDAQSDGWEPIDREIRLQTAALGNDPLRVLSAIGLWALGDMLDSAQLLDQIPARRERFLCAFACIEAINDKRTDHAMELFYQLMGQRQVFAA